MLATLAAALLAGISPLIGFTQDWNDDGPTRTSSPTIVHPRTLEPVEDAPRLPRHTTSFERSPQGDALAGLDGDDLVFTSTEKGHRLMRVPLGDVDQDPLDFSAPVVSWISPETILVIDRYEKAERAVTRLRVVSTVSGSVVGDPLTYDGSFLTARVAGRQLVVVHPDAGSPNVYHAGSVVPLAIVLDGDGRVAHHVELGELFHVGSLDRSLVVGVDRATRRTAVLRLDVRSGTVAMRRTFDRDPDSLASDQWLPASPGVAWLRICCDEDWTDYHRNQPLDRTDLTPLPRRRAYSDSIIETTRDGFLTDSGMCCYPNSRFTLRARSLDGKLSWRRKLHWGANVVAIGKYVYGAHLHDDDGPNEGPPFIDVIRLRDGRRVGHIRGYRVLALPSEGRSVEQVRRLEAFSTLG